MSNRPSLAFPNCLKSPSAFSRWWTVFWVDLDTELFVRSLDFLRGSPWVQNSKHLIPIPSQCVPHVFEGVLFFCAWDWRLLGRDQLGRSLGCGGGLLFVVVGSTCTTFFPIVRISRPCMCCGPCATCTYTLGLSCSASQKLNSVCRGPYGHTVVPVARCPPLRTTATATASTWGGGGGGAADGAPGTLSPSSVDHWLAPNYQHLGAGY